jgi:rubrerythrin
VLRLLDEALATEIVCVLRYKRHYYMADGIHAQAVAAEFLEHANEEQAHADQIAERITQLGGAPDLDPRGLASRSHSEYVEGESLVDMIREDLVAERIAVDSYRCWKGSSPRRKSTRRISSTSSRRSTPRSPGPSRPGPFVHSRAIPRAVSLTAQG